jgi:hypothetical protein
MRKNTFVLHQLSRRVPPQQFTRQGFCFLLEAEDEQGEYFRYPNF